MGCGASGIKDDQNLMKLKNLLDRFENKLNELENSNFSTKEEMQNLQCNKNIIDLQEQINETLKNSREKVEQISDKEELEEKQKELNDLSKRSEDLYAKHSVIVKTKLRDQLNQ